VSIDDTAPRIRSAAGQARGPDLGDTVITPQRPAVGTNLSTSRGRGSVSVPTDSTPNQASTFRYQIGVDEGIIGIATTARFGRSPTASRIADIIPPSLIRVSSPLGEISATHLQIKAVGSGVLVTDLRSSNGSVVRVPGRISRTLRGGESVVVAVGTVIDLGEGILIRILPGTPTPLREGTE
jgi:pSer/pThr/pTyr-binding forkhead associated (FHA) protein